MEFLKIVGFSTLAAICYGILHDQVTAHLCVEYFSIAHPPVFGTASPFILALGWGVIATWWIGLPLGVLAAGAARIGRGRRMPFAQVRSLILRLLVAMALCAVASGATGAWLAARGHYPLLDGWSYFIPRAKWVAFSADQWAHLASYASGVLGGLIVIACIVWLRVRRQPAAPP